MWSARTESSELSAVSGVALGVAQAGMKTAGKDDLLLVSLSPDTRTAARFTQNAFRAAPVDIAAAHVAATQGEPRYLLINTGNANAGTGELGWSAAMACCDAVATHMGVPVQAVLPFSTGVIGEPLPSDRIVAALGEAADDLSEDNWEQAAGAILTTDTHSKLRTVEVELGGQECRITGIAKGAGMICPDLATMLAFVATDVTLEQTLLETLLASAADASFNRITVDGDTSTNDAVTLSATGRSGVVIEADSPECRVFSEALTTLMIALAQDIVRDGEGASKFVEIRVKGGETQQAAEKVARTIAHSPLVKTALFASDPNWGRILAAIGRAGLAELDTRAVTIHINSVLIAEKGARAASYTEVQGQEAMEPTDLMVEVELSRGDEQAVIWTTDLSYDYVKINAEYRT